MNMDGGARFISIRPPMEIQPIAGLPPAQGFIGGPPPPRKVHVCIVLFCVFVWLTWSMLH